MRMEPQRKMHARLTRVHKVRPWYLRWTMLLIPAAIVGYAMFQRESAREHPLRDTVRTELCSLLPAPPVSIASKRQAPQPGATRSATCEYFGADDKLALRITLTSTRQLSSDGSSRPADEFAHRLSRARAQYGRSAPVEGAWEMAGAWHVGYRQSLLFVDEGVMVQLESERLDAKALAAHAGTVAAALRHPPDGTF